MRAIINSLSIALVAIVALTAPAAAEKTMIVVESGQTLGKIARKYDCTVKELQRANEMKDTMIYAGQTLIVPDCAAVGADHTPRKAKGKGKDKGGSKRLKHSESRRADPADYGLSSSSGKKVKAKKGQSIGKPWDGSLKNATKLGKGKGYFIRREHRAYGTSHMVQHIQKAIKAVRKRFPRVHTLAIGDLSAETGGDTSMHHSHQSGRDVDIGLYFKKKPKGYPDSFISYDSGTLDYAATWALLYAFARTADDDNGVQAIYLDQDLQDKLHKWAKDHSVPDSYLDQLFGGVVRHEPGHEDHLHVRFKCPVNDSGCE